MATAVGVRTLDAAIQRTLTGKLAFGGSQIPPVGLKVMIYMASLGCKRLVGETTTGADGRFNFNYTWNPGCLDFSQRIIAEVVENRQPFSNVWRLFGQDSPVVLHRIDRSFNVASRVNDLGDQTLSYGEIGRNLAQVNPPRKSHQQSLQYYLKLVMAAGAETIKSLIVSVFHNCLSSDRVQSIYDLFGITYAKRPATANQLLHELMNEICATDYREENGQIIWSASWDGLALDTPDSLPNVTVIANRGESLQLDQIQITFRGQETKVVRENDSLFPWAIFVARSVFATKGEAEIHLANGHLLPGIGAEAFFNHISPQNPLYSKVAPFLGQLDFINALGARGIIFGEGSVLELSALTAGAVEQVIVNYVKSKANYQTDLPKPPINAQDHRGRVSQLHYGILHQYFTDLVASHRAEITERKGEIYRFSAFMHEALQEIPEIMTDPNIFDQAAEERLVRCLTWLVFKTTFGHWSAHSRQGLLTDVRSASLAMRNFGLNAEGTGLAPCGNMEPRLASQQLSIARTLMNFNGDELMANPYGDIDPELIRRIETQRADYQPYNVDEMHLTTQI